ncbi:MAG: hypothetical protein D6710_06195 [Nitrospirae bacterium]|nr:MAG: hypothetical protein D6710_06195 [Nitrospirota bacterium]
MRKGGLIIHIVLFVVFLLCFIFINQGARAKRHYPEKGSLRFYRVSREVDVYRVYRMLNLKGVTVVHLSNTLGMQEFYPSEETEPIGYPVPVRDVLPLYEEGLNSSNFLFIASRAGMLRRVYNILPPSVFRLMKERLMGEFQYTVKKGRIVGFVRDIPQVITMLDRAPVIREPVVLNIDAGYFIEAQDPMRTVVELIRHFRDIRAVVFIDSTDRDYVTAQMREKLDIMLQALKRALL